MNCYYSQKHLRKLKKEWAERIAKTGIPIKKFCKMADVNYSTWLHMSNPTIRVLEKIESTLQALGR